MPLPIRPELLDELFELMLTGSTRAHKERIMIGLGIVAWGMSLRRRFDYPPVPEESTDFLLKQLERIFKDGTL